MRLLDTDIVIDLARRHPPAVAWFSSLGNETLGVPGFVVLELMEGCENALAMRRLRKWLAPFPIYWPSAQDCQRALDTYAHAWLSHHIDFIDVLIGECAIGLGVPLCTFNVRHFRAIPGLATEQPYERV